MLQGCEMPRVTTDTRMRCPSAVGYSTGRSGNGGIGISGATGMPFANGTSCCAWPPAAAAITSAARPMRRKARERCIIEELLVAILGLILRARAQHDAIADELRHQP